MSGKFRPARMAQRSGRCLYEGHCEFVVPVKTPVARGKTEKLPRVTRIFTEISISLSRCWRQWGSRCAIRAGRNLPDKEFRYLRTVIVTAAVYRGFDSKLSPLLLTFRHRAGVRPYTSPCGLAESCVFSKQSPPPGLCPPPPLARRRGPLIPKLRGQFAEFLQHRSLKRLGILYQSTCVGLGYGL